MAPVNISVGETDGEDRRDQLGAETSQALCWRGLSFFLR